MSGILQGKTALVTGASRGIGRAIAERLAASGALVAISYASNAAAAQEAVAAIEDQGGQAFALQADFERAEEVAALAQALDAELVRRRSEPALDILVNNAGSGGYANTPATSEDFYDATFARNTRAPFFLVQALFDRFRSGGSVINISSEGVRLNLPGTIAYNMAKAAQESFTRTLANELGPRGVRVNSVAPGFVLDTDINAGFVDNAEVLAQIQGLTALRRLGYSTDIANVVHMLVSPDASFMTGQLIEVSGGYRL
jgi:NAD(P)-dependent dehydrogenase (short-subunit alcohol dehydrogenase family)